MDLFSIISIIIVLSALFGYVNVRFIKLPNTIGLMVIAILFTLGLLASSYFTDYFLNIATHVVEQVDFETLLLDIMLGFLLFAGAMHTNFDQLRVQRLPVLVFSTLGVLASTFLVATLVYFVFPMLGHSPKYIHCLLFGALISPTDPIAVLGILKKAGVPKKLETKIVGESLFNDGVGVVVFLTIFSIAFGASHGAGHAEKVDRVVTPVAHVIQDDSAENHTETKSDSESVKPETEDPKTDGHDDKEDGEHAGASPTVLSVGKMFAQEVLGGILFGLLIGYVTFQLLRSIDNYEIEVMITLACVMGGYSLASYFHLSAPLAIVVAGLIVGNDTVRGTAMSAQTEQYVDQFWELVDMLLNAVLFVLIGLEMLILEITQSYVTAAGIAIVIVLGARYLSLVLPVRFFSKKLGFVPFTATVMTWGGLRGGISIALALSLPHSLNAGEGEQIRDLFVTVTYGVVVFSIIVQGLTVGMLANRLIGSDSLEATIEGKH
jgi:CPA1 family monovalent cation:H+ antiporter